MSNADRIAMSARLRQLSKEMTLGDPKTAAMLISAAKMVERGSYGPKEPPIADTLRLDFLEAEWSREMDWRTDGKGTDFPSSLYRRNHPITRAAIDKAIAETPCEPRTDATSQRKGDKDV